MNKPEILSGEAIAEIARKHSPYTENGYIRDMSRAIADAQRDDTYKKTLEQFRKSLNEITCILDVKDRDNALTNLIYELAQQREVRDGE